MSARVLAVALCVCGSFLACGGDASGQIVIKVGDEVLFKLGRLGQFQAEIQEATLIQAYGRIAPSGVAGQNAFTIQLQAFYF